MGLMHHNAIVATTWSTDRAVALREWIPSSKKHLVLEHETSLNGYTTFIVCPDGSKEGWADSVEGDYFRDSFVERLSKDNYEDGSSPWSWVEVSFAVLGQKVVRGNNEDCYAQEDEA